MSYFSIPRSAVIGENYLDGSSVDTNDGTKATYTATNVTYATCQVGYQKQCGVFGATSSLTRASLASIQGFMAFIYPTANTKDLFVYNTGTAKLAIDGSNNLTQTGLTNSTIYVNGQSSAALTLNAWNFVLVTHDSITAANWNFGASSFLGNAAAIRTFNAKPSSDDILRFWHEFNRKLGGGSDFGAYVPAPGLKFEMDSGLESSSQISVTNNSATLAQSDWLSLPKAVSFNGTTGSLGFTDSNTYSAITIGFRFYLNSLSSTRTPISTSGTGGYMFYVGTNGAGNWRTITGAANTATSSAGDFTTGTWYTVFMTYDGSVQNLYKNGTLIKSLTGLSGTIGSSSGYVGAYFDGLSSRMNGLISDIYIWNYAFTQDQIKFAGAAIESGRYPYAFRRSVPNAPSSPKFSIYLPSGKDISGNAKDATLINTPTAARLQQNGFLTFNGSSMAMTVPSSAYNPDGDTDNFSIAFWFVPAAIGTRAALFQKGASTTGTGYYQYTMEVTTGSKLDCQVGASAVSDTSCIGTTTLVNGRAYFGVMTYDAASKTFKNYLNGHLENTATHAYSTLAAPGRDWQFARRYRGDGVTDLFFNGKIGGLPMVFDRVLTLEEIQRLYFGTYVN